MTQQKHLKALIRARMAKTGERYTAARAHLIGRDRAPALIETAVFRAHDRHCMTAVFLPDDSGMISGGFGGQARIWNRDGEMVGELLGHEASVNAIVIHGGRVVTASSDKTVRLWDLPECTQLAELGRHSRQVTALGFDPAGGHVWSGAHDGRLHRFDSTSGELMATVRLDSAATGLAPDPQGGRIAVATMADGVYVLDSATGDVLHQPVEGTLVRSVRWASDGSFLLVGVSGAVDVWATDEWDNVRTLTPLGAGVLPMAISPDGFHIAIGWDNHVGMWTAGEEEPAAVVGGLPKGVYGLDFSHDGSELAMAAADGRVRRWSVA